MVMGGDSHSNDHGFQSRHRILDGHFSHIFVVKICNVCLKRSKINEKEAGVGTFKKIFDAVDETTYLAYLSCFNYFCQTNRLD